MSDFATLSVKERLSTRMELVNKARAIVDKHPDGKLSGETQAEWEKLDSDIEKLNGLINENRSEEAHKARQEKLASWSEALKTDPGRQSEPTKPGSKPDTDTPLSEVKFRGEALRIDDNPQLKALATPEYGKQFNKYLRGDAKADEKLGMQVSNNPKGGYLAPVGMVQQILKFMDDMVYIRAAGTVFPTNGAVSLGVVSWEADPGDADWTPEVPAANISEDTAAAVGKRELMPHGVSKLVKISQKMARTSIIPIEAYLAQRLAYKFAITCEKAYMTGTGVQQPLGLFTASADGVPTSRDVTSGTSNDFTFDDVIGMLYSLKAQYQAAATFLASREWFKRARKLKASGTGEYLWQPSPILGQPDLILGRPYKQSEYTPCQTSAAFTTGAYPCLLGDLSFYWIADSIQLEIQTITELFTLTNQIGYKGWLETDGQPVMAEAFARMKLG